MKRPNIQTLSVGYAFLDDNILDQNEELLRYSLNTLKHQYTTRLSTQFFKNVRQNIVYKYAERTTGQTYNVWDASLAIKVKQAEFTIINSVQLQAFGVYLGNICRHKHILGNIVSYIIY